MAQSHFTPVKRKPDVEGEIFEGFVHSVSPPKKSKRNNSPYFNMVLQTDRNDFHNAVYFTNQFNSENIRKQMLAASEKKRPIRLNTATKSISFANPTSFDINCNSNTNILPIDDVNFPHRNPPISPQIPIANIKSASIQEIVSVNGKVTKLIQPETKLSKDGKPLTLNKFHIADETGSIEVCLWDAQQIFELNNSYSLHNVMVKEFNGIKSLTYMTTSTNKIIPDINNVSKYEPEVTATQKVTDEISSVTVTIVLKCCSCGKELVAKTSKFIKCTNTTCLMKQKITSLIQTTSTKLKMKKSFVKYNLTNSALFQFATANDVNIENFDSDDIEEFLLNIEEELIFTVINNNVIEKLEKMNKFKID